MPNLRRPNATLKFLDICLRNVRSPLRMNFMKILLREEPGPIKSLKKLAAERLIENALEDEGKKQALKELVQSSRFNFDNFTFGSHAALTNFILDVKIPGLISIKLESNSLVVNRIRERREQKVAEYTGEDATEKLFQLISCIVKTERQKFFARINKTLHYHGGHPRDDPEAFLQFRLSQNEHFEAEEERIERIVEPYDLDISSREMDSELYQDGEVEVSYRFNFYVPTS